MNKEELQKNIKLLQKEFVEKLAALVAKCDELDLITQLLCGMPVAKGFDGLDELIEKGAKKFVEELNIDDEDEEEDEQC